MNVDRCISSNFAEFSSTHDIAPTFVKYSPPKKTFFEMSPLVGFVGNGRGKATLTILDDLSLGLGYVGYCYRNVGHLLIKYCNWFEHLTIYYLTRNVKKS